MHLPLETLPHCAANEGPLPCGRLSHCLLYGAISPRLARGGNDRYKLLYLEIIFEQFYLLGHKDV